MAFLEIRENENWLYDSETYHFTFIPTLPMRISEYVEYGTFFVVKQKHTYIFYCSPHSYLYLVCKRCRAKQQETYSAHCPSACEFPVWKCHGQCMFVSKSGILLANTHKLCRTERRLVWFWTVLLILFLNNSCLLNKLFEYPAFVFSGYNACVRS